MRTRALVSTAGAGEESGASADMAVPPRLVTRALSRRAARDRQEEDYIILLGHLSAQAKVLMEDDSNNRAANREAYTETERGLIELHAELVLLDNYSMLNYLALVKILKKHDKLTKAKLQDKFLAKIKKQPFWATRQLQRLIRNVKDTVENLQSSGAVVSSTEKPTLLDLPQLPDEPEDAEEEADGDAERAGGAKEACTVAEEADTSADKGAGRDEDDRDELVAGNVTATTMSRFVCALDAWQRQGFRGSSFNIRQSLTPSPMMGMRATELRGSSHAERPTTSDAHPDDASVEDATAQPAAKRPRVDNA